MIHTIEEIHRIIRSYIADQLLVPRHTAHQQCRGEESLVVRYRQRELHELVQNAVDRARRSVVLCHDPQAGRLIVGNDGRPVSIEPEDGPHPRSDFEGLCSVNTSRKRAWEAIGNKGVGFKSVFGAARTVTVWSRHPRAGWWGFRVRHPFKPRHAAWSPGVEEYCRSLQDKAAPSFYFPEPLRPTAADLPSSSWVQRHDLETLVVLEDLHDETLAWRYRDFRDDELYFIAARYPQKADLRIYYLDPTGEETTRAQGIDIPDRFDRWPISGTAPLMDEEQIRPLARENKLKFKWRTDSAGTAVPPHLRLMIDRKSVSARNHRTMPKLENPQNGHQRNQ